MFDNWKRERRIRKVLSRLARQRVAAILQPGNVPIIELALERNEETNAALLTCEMRGWVEVLHEAVATRKLTADMKMPSGPLFDKTETMYRLTDGGWNALNRAHMWTFIGVLIGVLSLVATVGFAG